MTEEDDRDRLLRWIGSLRRTSIATRAIAQQHGEDWEYYALSMDSAAAQEAQAAAFEAQLAH